MAETTRVDGLSLTEEQAADEAFVQAVLSLPVNWDSRSGKALFERIVETKHRYAATLRAAPIPMADALAHRWMQHALNLRDLIANNDQAGIAAEISRHDKYLTTYTPRVIAPEGDQ